MCLLFPGEWEKQGRFLYPTSPLPTLFPEFSSAVELPREGLSNNSTACLPTKRPAFPATPIQSRRFARLHLKKGKKGKPSREITGYTMPRVQGPPRSKPVCPILRAFPVPLTPSSSLCLSCPSCRDSRGWIITFFRGEIKGSGRGLLVFLTKQTSQRLFRPLNGQGGYEDAADVPDVPGGVFSPCPPRGNSGALETQGPGSGHRQRGQAYAGSHPTRQHTWSMTSCCWDGAQSLPAYPGGVLPS